MFVPGARVGDRAPKLGGDDDVLSNPPRDGDEDDDEALDAENASVTAALSAALASDLGRLARNSTTTPGAPPPSRMDDEIGGELGDDFDDDSTVPEELLEASRRAAFERRAKDPNCRVCASAAKYTCPRCGVRTCSLGCIKKHKQESGCSGIVDVAGMVPLSEFNDRQLQRDFAFIQDVSRVVDNAHRGLNHVWRFTHRTLPPPLHALREAAKKRGVLCQITSEGMAKRDRNTSRYDRRRDAIIWRVEFNVKGSVKSKNFTAGTSWGNERFLLQDVFQHVWELNPQLPCFHIRRGYNRASNWVDGGGTGTAPGSLPGNIANAVVDPDDDGTQLAPETEEQQTQVDGQGASTGVVMEDEGTAVQEPNDAVTMTMKLNVQRYIAEQPNGIKDLIFVMKADRLSNTEAYYPLNPTATLHDNLRSVFFVNEFPEIIVALKEDAALYPLITDALRVQVRESFRSKRPANQPGPHRPPAPGFGEGADGDAVVNAPPRVDFSTLTDEQRQRMSRIPCKNFRRHGTCDRGDACPFWHCPASEVPACRSMVNMGQCPLGPKCSFSHDEAVVMRTRDNPEYRRVQRGNGPPSFHHPQQSVRRGPSSFAQQQQEHHD